MLIKYRVVQCNLQLDNYVIVDVFEAVIIKTSLQREITEDNCVYEQLQLPVKARLTRAYLLGEGLVCELDGVPGTGGKGPCLRLAPGELLLPVSEK